MSFYSMLYSYHKLLQSYFYVGLNISQIKGTLKEICIVIFEYQLQRIVLKFSHCKLRLSPVTKSATSSNCLQLNIIHFPLEGGVNYLPYIPIIQKCLFQIEFPCETVSLSCKWLSIDRYSRLSFCCNHQVYDNAYCAEMYLYAVIRFVSNNLLIIIYQHRSILVDASKLL